MRWIRPRTLDFARATLLAAVLVTTKTQAADFALNAGALEVVALPQPQHLGLYLYAGPSLAFVFEKVVLIGSLSLEWSPDQLRGGLVLGVTADFPLTSRLGLDVNVTLIHDQAGTDFARASFFIGGGPGVTFFFGKQAISPFISFFYGAGGASLVPGINFSSTL